MHELFHKSKIKSIHWDKGQLAKSMFDNLQQNKNLLSQDYTNYQAYSDIESMFIVDGKENWIFMYEYFELLDRQYPHSKFILNTRNLEGWINSRLNHYSNYYLDGNKVCKRHQPIEYWKLHCRFYNVSSKNEIVEIWKKQWITHHEKVLHYFQHRKEDLLVYDLDKDNLNKFKTFFPNINFSLEEMPITHKTKLD